MLGAIYDQFGTLQQMFYQLVRLFIVAVDKYEVG